MGKISPLQKHNFCCQLSTPPLEWRIVFTFPLILSITIFVFLSLLYEHPQSSMPGGTMAVVISVFAQLLGGSDTLTGISKLIEFHHALLSRRDKEVIYLLSMHDGRFLII